MALSYKPEKVEQRIVSIMFMFNKNKGFTLIELLVVIAIIAILASIALLSLAPAQKAGRDARRIADLRGAQSILQLYYNKCGYFPNADISLDDGVCIHNGGIINGTGGTVYADWLDLSAQLGTYGASIISQDLPNDPGANPGPSYDATLNYGYAVSADAASYTLRATLESDNNVLKNDIDNAVYVDLNCGDPAADVEYCVQF